MDRLIQQIDVCNGQSLEEDKETPYEVPTPPPLPPTQRHISPDDLLWLKRMNAQVQAIDFLRQWVVQNLLSKYQCQSIDQDGNILG